MWHILLLWPHTLLCNSKLLFYSWRACARHSCCFCEHCRIWFFVCYIFHPTLMLMSFPCWIYALFFVVIVFIECLWSCLQIFSLNLIFPPSFWAKCSQLICTMCLLYNKINLDSRWSCQNMMVLWYPVAVSLCLMSHYPFLYMIFSCHGVCCFLLIVSCKDLVLWSSVCFPLRHCLSYYLRLSACVFVWDVLPNVIFG